MSAAINAVAFAGWDVSVSSAAHHGWLASADVPVVAPAEPLDGVLAAPDEPRWIEEEEELIALVMAIHRSRR